MSQGKLPETMEALVFRPTARSGYVARGPKYL